MDELIHNELNVEMDNESISFNSTRQSLFNSPSTSSTTLSPANNSTNPTVSVSTCNTPDNNCDTSQISLLMSDDLFTERLQDKGRELQQLATKTYRMSKIPPVGPEGNELYYPDLWAIAVDFCKTMTEQKELGLGWLKIPKNIRDMKQKIFSRLLALRKQKDDGTYVLDQKQVLLLFQSAWGAGADSNTIHHNDRARLFGIVMSLPQHRLHYERLSKGVQTRADLDDSRMSIQQIFQYIALSFNNEEVIVDFLDEFYDVPGWEAINLNDTTRIRITRDCECKCFY